MTPTMIPICDKRVPGNPSTATSSVVRLSDRSNGEELRVLSEDDWKFWIHNGYVIIKNAVPKEQVKRTADFLWEFEEKDPRDPATCIFSRAEMKMKELTNTAWRGVQSPAVVGERQNSKVHAAFCGYLGD